MDFTKEQKDAAYKAAEKNDIKGVPTAIFGEDQEKDVRPVTERVKTFEDAVKELGESHPYVNIYDTIVNEYPAAGKDVMAYLRLRIITAALNERWEYRITENMERWCPYFCPFCVGYIAAYERKGEVMRKVGYETDDESAFGGIVYVGYDYIPVMMSMGPGGCIFPFRTSELAEYAGKQFIEEYYQLYVGL